MGRSIDTDLKVDMAEIWMVKQEPTNLYDMINQSELSI